MNSTFFKELAAIGNNVRIQNKTAEIFENEIDQIKGDISGIQNEAKNIENGLERIENKTFELAANDVRLQRDAEDLQHFVKFELVGLRSKAEERLNDEISNLNGTLNGR